MNDKDFYKLVNEILKRSKNLLIAKGKEYSTDEDKLHNFKRASEVQRCSPEKALIGMFTKHIVSLLDIVDKMDNNVYHAPTKQILQEKITDSINYLILLEALIMEVMGYVVDEE